MKNFLRMFSLMMALFACAFQAMGASYYVASFGSGSGTGGMADPLTLSQVNTMTAGTLASGTTFLFLDRDGSTYINLQAAGGLSTGSNTGLIFKSAYPGQRWGARCDIIVSAASWTLQSGKTYTYYTPSNQFATEAQNNIYLKHIIGANYTAVASTIEATPGCFFTGTVSGTGTIYTWCHPNGNSNPTTDGNTYTLSYPYGGDGSGNIIQIGGGSVFQDCHVYGITALCGTSDETSGPGGGQYTLVCGHGTPAATVKNCIFEFGNKHTVGAVGGGNGGSAWFIDVFAGPCSPYGVSGGTTNFVSYADSGTGTTCNFIRCKMVYANAVANSATGIKGNGWVSHTGGGATIAQENLIDCNFGDNNFSATSPDVSKVVLRNVFTRGCESGACAAIELHNCTWTGTIAATNGILGDGCLFAPNSGYGPGGGIVSSAAFTNCAFELRSSDHGGWQYLYAPSPTSITVTSCVVLQAGSYQQGGNSQNLSLFGFSSDATKFHCDYNTWVSDKGGSAVNNAGFAGHGGNIYFSDWQALGQDAHGSVVTSISGLNLSNYGYHEPTTPTSVNGYHSWFGW